MTSSPRATKRSIEVGVEGFGSDLGHRPDHHLGQARGRADDRAVADLRTLDRRLALHLDVVVEVRLADPHAAGGSRRIGRSARPDRSRRAPPRSSRRASSRSSSRASRATRARSRRCGRRRTAAQQPVDRLELAPRAHRPSSRGSPARCRGRRSGARGTRARGSRCRPATATGPCRSRAGVRRRRSISALPIKPRMSRRIQEVEAGVRHQRQLPERLVGLGVEMLAELAERRLLDELGHPAVVVGQHDAVLLRHLVGLARHGRDRRDGAAPQVRLHHRREIEVDHRVGREHERRLRDVPVLHHPERRVGAARRQRRRT